MPCPKPLPVTSDLSYKTKDQWEIARSSIVLIERLGAGQFGEVWRGKRRRFVRPFPSLSHPFLPRLVPHDRYRFVNNLMGDSAPLPIPPPASRLPFFASLLLPLGLVQFLCERRHYVLKRWPWKAHVPCKRPVVQAAAYREACTLCEMEAITSGLKIALCLLCEIVGRVT